MIFLCVYRVDTDNKYQSLHNGYASGEFMPKGDTMAGILD
jgi:hypothetical protein